jgi:hypothetical protein
MKINEYGIDEMISMFGDRIKSAVFKWDDGSKGIDAKKMGKLIKKWKFWNKDIREAYKNYYGIILAPYIIVNKPPVIMCGVNSEVLMKPLNKEISERYRKTAINPDFYCVIKKV